MAKKKKKSRVNINRYYDATKMSTPQRYSEIHKILRGDYDNWKSFGYSGGLCSGK